jgi:protein SCO1
MKHALKISIPITITLIAFFAMIVFSKSSGETSNRKSETSNIKKDDNKKRHSCCSDETGSNEYSENSIYQLKSTWVDQSEKGFELSALMGKKVVLSMIFANCTYACPIIINDMKKVEEQLSQKEKQQTEFIVISIDPERDTPEKLKAFAERYNLDLKRWKMLTGSKGDIRKIAALFGFSYVKDEKGDYSHSNFINVLDKKGEIAYQHVGLNKEIIDIVERLKTIN